MGAVSSSCCSKVNERRQYDVDGVANSAFANDACIKGGLSDETEKVMATTLVAAEQQRDPPEEAHRDSNAQQVDSGSAEKEEISIKVLEEASGHTSAVPSPGLKDNKCSSDMDKPDGTPVLASDENSTPHPEVEPDARDDTALVNEGKSESNELDDTKSHETTSQSKARPKQAPKSKSSAKVHPQAKSGHAAKVKSKADVSKRRKTADANSPGPADGSAEETLSYEGQFSHPTFGGKPIGLTVEFETATSGSWTAMKKTCQIEIKSEGDHVILRDSMTELDGHRDGKGVLKGSVFQEGVGGGSFKLKPRKVDKVKASSAT